jgi:hypothetical protein
MTTDDTPEVRGGYTLDGYYGDPELRAKHAAMQTTDDIRPQCLHDDAIDFRTEPATVQIGKCPRCGEDTEWQFHHSPQSARHAALVAAARDVIDWNADPHHRTDPGTQSRIAALRAALDGEPR